MRERENERIMEVSGGIKDAILALLALIDILVSFIVRHLFRDLLFTRYTQSIERNQLNGRVQLVQIIASTKMVCKKNNKIFE